MGISRRSFLRLSAAGAVAVVGTGLYTWQVEPFWLDVVRRPLPLANLPPSLEGVTLVQLSDIHVGRRVSDDYIRSAFARVTALKPDIVVYTGDFLSYHSEIFDQIAPIYDRAPHGRLATLGSFGNHDYGPNWAHPEIAAELQRVLSRRGIDVLRGEMRDVGGLQIVGLDDLWANQFDPNVLSRLRPDRASLVLSHNPDTVDLPGWETCKSWILAGHTHGGQCKPPFLPPPIVPVENKRYTAGAFALSGNRNLYINSGIGFLFQVRFGVRPEITVFTLTSATA
ncbi:MAG: metallophosphoesterase [Gemmatimonadaceae bacterium]